ncbi:MAG: hypothetical protein PHX18_02065 [Candidatus Gastranaerophilales bacterium]|nr:hypothetical protein [Candidatus Gastranaerophilales bacterium]
MGTEGIKGITEVAVQPPLDFVNNTVNNLFGYTNQTLSTIFDGTARVVAPLAQTAANLGAAISPNQYAYYANPYALALYAQQAPVYAVPAPVYAANTIPCYGSNFGAMYSDNTFAGIANSMQMMPAYDKYNMINSITSGGMVDTFGGSASAMNTMMMNGYNGFGGYGYYGGNVSEMPRNGYNNPCSTVNNPINNTSQNGQASTSWYEAYRRSTNLTDEQRAIAAKHEKISRLTDPNGSEYQKIKLSVSKLKLALETNEEGVAEAMLRNLAKNPEELAAVELLYAADTPGSSLRKDIVKNFNYWGFGWMGNRTAKADEMLGLLNKVAFEHPGNFALAMANATDGWGTYKDIVSSLVLDSRFTKEFAYCADQEYTGRTGRMMLNDVNKKWTGYGGNKTAIQQKLAI